MKSTIIILAGFYLYELLSLCRCQGHYENVAVNKPCNMSSQQYPQPNCSGAVNNNTDGVYTEGGDNCIHTSGSFNTSWWEVDLGRPYPVCVIHLWPREGYQDRMVGVTVTLDGSLFVQFTANNTPRERNITLTCGSPNSPPWASVIRLSKIATAQQVRERDHTINVCEVQVISCSDAYWGSQCNKTCGHCGNNQVCDKETGHCDTCSPGWMLPFCDTECTNGFWGSNCGMTCGHCGQGEVCNKVTGHCRTCLPGWEMPLCSVCADGNYGTDCGGDCGECSDGAACDKTTGHCTSCSPGKKLPMCTEDCSDGYWGRNCSVTCGYCGDGEVCDKMTGHCPTCRPGTEPPLCVTACDDGWWDVNCEGRCGNCSDSQVCDKVTGHCSRCSPGFVPPFCRSVASVKDGSTSIAVIVGAVIGVVVAVVLIVTLVLLFLRRHRSRLPTNNCAHAAATRDTSRNATTAGDVADGQPSRGAAQRGEENHTERSDHMDNMENTHHNDHTYQSRVSMGGDYLQLDEQPPLYNSLSPRGSQHVYTGFNS